MSMGGKKGKKGSLGTSFIVEKIPLSKKLSCSNCINFNSDNSCSAKPVFITEIGYDFWKQCDKFSLDPVYDTEENRSMVSKNRKKKKKKKQKKRVVIENSPKTSSMGLGNSYNMEIYPTEKKSSELVYAERGRTKGEKLSDERVKKFAKERERIKQIEDNEKYTNLMRKIGQRQKLEQLYISYFKKEIDTLDFIDEIDNIIEGKNISESQLVFIREHIYKIHNK